MYTKRLQAKRRARAAALRLHNTIGTLGVTPTPETYDDDGCDLGGRALVDEFTLEHTLTATMKDGELSIETVACNLDGTPDVDLDQTWLKSVHTPEALKAHRDAHQDRIV